LHLNRHLCFLFVSVILQYSIGMSTKKNHTKRSGENFPDYYLAHDLLDCFPTYGGFFCFPSDGGFYPQNAAVV